MPRFLKTLTSVTFYWLLLAAPCFAQRAVFFGANKLETWSLGYCGYDCPAATDIDWHGITHLTLAWAEVQADCSINMSDQGIDSIAAALITAAHAQGVKVLVSHYAWDGGSGVTFAACTTAGNLATLVANIAANVATYGFDGVDFDWEPFSSATNGTKMVNLIAATRTALPRPKIITAAAIVDEHAWWGSQPTIVSNLDRLNVMSYDLWTGESYSYHHTALTIQGNAPDSWSIQLAKERFITGGWPAAKMNIGLAFYGYQWTGGTSPNVNGPRITWTVGSPTRDQIHYVDIVPLITDPGNYNYDAPVETPYLSANSGAASWLTYDNPRSIAVKVNWARERGLGGVFIWNLKLDNTPANNPKSPLLNAVKNAR